MANLLQQIIATADAIGFPSAVAIAQLQRESGNFRSDVIYGPYEGAAGERGLAQFIPGTWARFGSGNPYDPADSLAAWARYTSYLANLFSGDITKILQAYNGGEGNVQRGTVSTAAKNYASQILSQALQISQNQNLSIISTSSELEAEPFSLNSLSIFGLNPALSALAVLGLGIVVIGLVTPND